MRYRLAPHVSYCRIGEGFVFLDRRRDRYWCLEGAMAEAFASLADGVASQASAPALQNLTASGLLTQGPGRAIAPCAAVVPRASILDRPSPRVSIALRVGALLRTETARLALNFRGLHRTLARLEGGRPVRKMHPTRLAGLAAAYTMPGWFHAAEGECLRRSIGLMTALSNHGQPADLVMAVKLQPFAAHCWVQTDALLLNERYDRVRDFTPVLVL